MSISQVTTRDTQLERQRGGKLQLSLTNFDNTLEPAIAAGSVVEVGGSLYVVTSDEAITGWAGIGNDTDCYVKMVPGAPMTAAFVTAAPTWSHAKQGWYNGNDRYVAGLHRGASAAAYEDKWVYQRSQDNNANHRFLGEGTVAIDGDVTVEKQATISKGCLSSTARVLTGTDLTGDDIFDFLSPVMAVGAYMRVNASVSIEHSTTEIFGGAMVLAHRQSSTVIGFYGSIVGISSGTGLSYSDLFADGAAANQGAAISGNATVWPQGVAVEKCVIAITY